MNLKAICEYYLIQYKKKKREKRADFGSYNVKEIFLNQFIDGKCNRLDTVVRYLAIDNYYGKNEYGFELYKKMQGKRIKQEYVEESVNKFVKLIASFEAGGYKENSLITVDKDLSLFDGSHRLALALWHGIEKINCKVYNEKVNVTYGVEWFIENDFSIEEIKIIMEKADELLAECRKGIFMILWPPVSAYFDEITDKISMLCNVYGVEDKIYDDVIFEKIVNGVYHIDDVEKWKIEKKLGYMREYDKKVRIAYFCPDYPHFRRKGLNKKSLIIQGEVIKAIIRGCYKDKVPEYFYDIIIHTADNYEQTNYISSILNSEISLKDYFGKIGELKWMLIKTEVPYMPEDFPDHVPFGKDCDIICDEDDFEELKRRSKDYFSMKYQGVYEIKEIEEDGKYRIRLEIRGFLIYQIDIAARVSGIKPEFIRESLNNRIYIKGYYISAREDEVYYRMNEYEKNSSKTWHLDYVENYKELFLQERMENIKE